jgi:hypothetical protein
MTAKIGEQEERTLNAMEPNKEYSCRSLKRKAKLTAGACDEVMKKLVTKKYVMKRELTSDEIKTYENGHTKFVYTKVITE